mmetsp:Transcript_9899/g.14591  ORF Transcript_9899/g.14591 Transcript_9899/m.14591 type:complete len:213 (+) Transcript_9899:6-644(+)
MGPLLKERLKMMFIGALHGGITSFVVGTSLQEITYTPIFSMIFGFMLEILSGFIMMKVFYINKRNRLDSNNPILTKVIRYFVVFNAFCLLCAGFFCVFLDHYWFAFVYSWIKVIIYTILATNLTFGFTWTVYEIIRNHRNVNQRRFFITLMNALITGIITGFLFGFFDTVADEQYERYGRFIGLQATSIPLSIVLSSLVNFFTTKLNKADLG